MIKKKVKEADMCAVKKLYLWPPSLIIIIIIITWDFVLETLHAAYLLAFLAKITLLQLWPSSRRMYKLKSEQVS